jgi:outer membrane protein TolC
MTKHALTLSFLAVSILPLFPSNAAAQIGLPSRSSRSQPQQLPLSGNTPGSVTTGQATAPSASSNSVNTLNTSIQIQGPFLGSTPTGVATKETLLLSLDEAIKRALAYNLGLIGAEQAERQARAQRLGNLAQLLPDINAIGTVGVQQTSLATVGLQSAGGAPRLQFARVLGPFNFFEAGAAISQAVFDLTAIRNYRSSKEIAFANKLTVRDSRDLVILAVAGAYLQVVAEGAQVDSAQAQLETARALYEQAVDQNRAGLNARIDVNRSLVEFQTQQLRLISLETDLATQKLALARLIGLPLGQAFMLTTAMEYHPAAPVVLEEALEKAFESRADLQAAKAQVRAAMHARKAAEAERTPAITLNGNYLLAGVNPAQSNGVFAVFAGIDFPIWRGGRIQADIGEADAVLAQRRAEYEDTSGRVDFEVRNAFLRLNATERQLTVAESNRALARDTLRQARDRFAAGVADTVEVVQAQESVAAAEQDYISGLYAHYLARLSLARATGDAQEGIASLLRPRGP